jgi:virulence factor mviN homolog
LVWYNSPSLIEWNAMSFFNRVYWLAWLIVLAAIVYGGMLLLLGIRKQHLSGAN